MSKAEQANSERIPSYEESIARSSNPSTQSTSKTSQRQSLQQRTKQERLRRINNLISEDLEPAIAASLNDGIDHITLIVLPSDSFPQTMNVTEKSITSPVLKHHTTLVHLSSDYKSSFLHQFAFISDLAELLMSTLASPSSSQQLDPSQEQPAASAPSDLPARPSQKSWLKRTFSLPPANHDPTGSTGAWNLGWKSEEDPSAIQKGLKTDDVSLTVQLENVSFRTESEMGLMESKTVKCVWLDLEMTS